MRKNKIDQTHRTSNHLGKLGLFAVFCLAVPSLLNAAPPRALPEGDFPADVRLSPLRDLGGNYFPFQQVGSLDAWENRATALRRQVEVATGMWPRPSRTPLNAVVHSPVTRDDYIVWRVYFESFPGHFVTGSLYRPKNQSSRLPAVLSPHGHFQDGRFHRLSDAELMQQISIGAERFLAGGRHPIQSRCVQLARMGCVVFHYDLEGYADSIQKAGHRNGVRSHMNSESGWGLASPKAELRLQNLMGLQTWNSIRAFDFLSGLPDVDPDRIAVTGASGGGTQTFILMAVDNRPAAAVPCVMVSTGMQGGCICENAPYLRIGAGNVDLAALTAPRPMGLTAADDWTIELETKGYPDLKNVYAMYGKEGLLRAVFHTQFKHNYNSVNRMFMYDCMNDFLDLGLDAPILERNFVPLTQEEMTVWTDDHPAPQGDQTGETHEKAMLNWWAEDVQRQFNKQRKDDSAGFAASIRGGWDVILGKQFENSAEVRIEEVRNATFGKYQGQMVLVADRSNQRQLPALMLLSNKGNQKQIVIWLTDEGKSGLLNSKGEPIDAVCKLLEEGYTVIGVDLLHQGEFLADGSRLTRQPMNGPQPGDGGESRELWEYFSGFTFGYNYPLFSLRAQDVALTARAAQSLDNKIGKVYLVGQGKEVGAVALASRLLAEDTISKTVAMTEGFQFASVKRFDDPMFVPGAVRYGDVAGMAELNGKGLLWLDGSTRPTSGEAFIPWLIE